MKRSISYYTTVIGATLSLVAAQAGAATVPVNVTLDVNDIVPGAAGFTGGVQNSPPFSPAYSVDLAVGDTLDFTIDFAGSQTLTINNLSMIWAFSYGGPSSSVTGTGTLSFLDTAGNSIFTSNSKTDTEGSAHFGQFFYNPSDFSGLPNPITFGGVRYVGTVDSYGTPGVTTRTYSIPAFYFNARSFTSSSGTVPDSSSAALIFSAGILPLLALRRFVVR